MFFFFSNSLFNCLTSERLSFHIAWSLYTLSVTHVTIAIKKNLHLTEMFLTREKLTRRLKMNLTVLMSENGLFISVSLGTTNHQIDRCV